MITVKQLLRATDKWRVAFLNPAFLTRFMALLVVSRPVGMTQRTSLSHLCSIFNYIFLSSLYA